MWQTKYDLAVPKNLRVGVNFRPCIEGYILSGRPRFRDLTPFPSDWERENVTENLGVP